jgi:hypothetical protein
MVLCIMEVLQPNFLVMVIDNRFVISGVYKSNALTTPDIHINGSSKWLHSSASKSNRPDTAL